MSDKQDSAIDLFKILEKLRSEIEWLIKQNNQLKEENSLRDQLIDSLAHDLRSVIGTLQNYAEILSEENAELSSSEIKTLCDGILQMTHSVTEELLENVLNLARERAGRLELEITPTNVYDIVNAQIKMLQQKARNKEIDLINQLPCGCFALCDMTTIAIVIRNLIANAIKFTLPGGKVIISADCNDQDIVTISVEDNGVGIPPEKIPHLFDIGKLYTTHGTNSERGSGLGLKLCNDFVQKNNGSLNIISEPKVGTKACIKLTKTLLD